MTQPPDQKSVLFVCLGNICRSAAAEGVMNKLLAEQDLDDQVQVDSAGTINYHAGEPADARMRRTARQRGYELTSISRQIRQDDFRTFDLIIAMDQENLRDLEERAPNGADNLHLLSNFLPAGAPRDMPDPYYGGPNGFETVLDLLEDACPRILHQLIDG